MDDKQKQPSKSDIKKIEKMLENSQKKEPNIRRKSKQLSVEEKYKLGNSIATVLSEYTDCYILLGFDTNGNEMILVNSRNNMEKRALADLASDFMDMGGFDFPSFSSKEDISENDDSDGESN